MLQEGKKYLYGGWFGNGPCFEELNGITSENTDGEIYLFGKDGYYLMKRGFVELESKECVECISTNPITFKIANKPRFIFEVGLPNKNNVEAYHQVLKRSNSLGIYSFYDVNYICTMCTPEQYKLIDISEDDAEEYLLQHVNTLLESYCGSVEGHRSFVEEREFMLTVLFSCEVAKFVECIDETGLLYGTKVVRIDNSFRIVTRNGEDVCFLMKEMKKPVIHDGTRINEENNSLASSMSKLNNLGKS